MGFLLACRVHVGNHVPISLIEQTFCIERLPVGPTDVQQVRIIALVGQCSGEG